MEKSGIRIPLKAGIPEKADSAIVRKVIGTKVHTVCQEAACPNLNQCFKAGTATFLILGRICTRNCTFCNIENGKPGPPDPEEPDRIAASARSLGLKYIVITSVTRDDLEDGGAAHFAETVRAVRRLNPASKIEVLIPDFRGNTDSIEKIFKAAPDVINHNLETVPSLYGKVRPQADYHRSLNLLALSVSRGFITKTGIILGLGEKIDEVRKMLSEVRNTGTQIITIGQYLSPSVRHYPVKEFIQDSVFLELEKEALALGFSSAACGPRVRSSYLAEKVYLNI